MRRKEASVELLDGPLEVHALRDNLRDLERVNRWLGGRDLSWRALRQVMATLPATDPITLLDVGTGAADIPRFLCRQAAAEGRRLEIEAVDKRPEIVALAQAAVADGSAVKVSLADPGIVDYPSGSFDIVHSSLVLHHHEPDEARSLLAEMARVARHAVIVNDLQRARRWWIGASVFSRIATANRYTRHDAPLSVRRAYTPDELSAMAGSVGLREEARLSAAFGHRYALVLVPPP